MRVLYVARLFSGLETSVVNERWQPTGVPTIYKMIEALDAEAAELRVVLAKKGGFSVWTASRDRHLRLQGLNAAVTVLAGIEALPAWLGPLRSKLSELRQLFHILVASWGMAPDVIYIDHGNIWAAGLLARLCRRPVLCRLMGVYPAMREALRGTRPAHAILRWCYRAPYAAVVCTQDGSGIEPWLEKALDPAVPRYLLLNGADTARHDDLPEAVRQRPEGRVSVLFLGKMEKAKGCEEFLAAFLQARQRLPGRLYAIMIGAGSRLASLKETARQAGAAEDVLFIDRLPHSQVMAVLAVSDIYVSLNRLGNLSNANLEAMRAGACMVFPASQPETAIDVVTDRLIPAEAALRIPSAEDTAALAEAVASLAADPDRRGRMRKAIATIAEQALSSWDLRVAREVNLVRCLVQRLPLPAADGPPEPTNLVDRFGPMV